MFSRRPPLVLPAFDYDYNNNNSNTNNDNNDPSFELEFDLDEYLLYEDNDFPYTSTHPASMDRFAAVTGPSPDNNKKPHSHSHSHISTNNTKTATATTTTTINNTTTNPHDYLANSVFDMDESDIETIYEDDDDDSSSYVSSECNTNDTFENPCLCSQRHSNNLTKSTSSPSSCFKTNDICSLQKSSLSKPVINSSAVSISLFSNSTTCVNNDSAFSMMRPSKPSFSSSSSSKSKSSTATSSSSDHQPSAPAEENLSTQSSRGRSRAPKSIIASNTTTSSSNLLNLQSNENPLIALTTTLSTTRRTQRNNNNKSRPQS